MPRWWYRRYGKLQGSSPCSGGDCSGRRAIFPRYLVRYRSFLGVQVLDRGSIVYDGAADGVNKEGGCLYQLNHSITHAVDRFLGGRDLQRDIVAAPEDLILVFLKSDITQDPSGEGIIG